MSRGGTGAKEAGGREGEVTAGWRGARGARDLPSLSAQTAGAGDEKWGICAKPLIMRVRRGPWGTARRSRWLPASSGGGEEPRQLSARPRPPPAPPKGTSASQRPGCGAEGSGPGGGGEVGAAPWKRGLSWGNALPAPPAPAPLLRSCQDPE